MRIVFAIIAVLVCGSAFAQSSSLNAPALAQSTPTAASSWTIVGQHTLLGFTVAAPTAGFVLVFDATSPPADGTVTPSGCFPLQSPASGGQWSSISMANTPLAAGVTNGISIVYSTGASCFTKAASATAFISVLYQ